MPTSYAAVPSSSLFSTLFSDAAYKVTPIWKPISSEVSPFTKLSALTSMQVIDWCYGQLEFFVRETFEDETVNEGIAAICEATRMIVSGPFYPSY